MNIANKLTVGLVSIAMVVSATVAFPAPVAHAESVEDLTAMLASLQAQLSALEGPSGSAGAAVPVQQSATVSNAACPFVWSRNLSVGSTGDDVRQLQRFLNGNPRTQVATSGVGSPGNETSYYGPATARAVSAFQEMYAAQILIPLGLPSTGTGGFYTSTRNHMNNLCQSAPVASNVVPQQPVQNPVPNNPQQPVQRPVASGDSLAVTVGQQPADSYAVQGAQRVPFTSFVLTAGNDDVRIEGIRIRRFGLSSSDNFEKVALVDVNGIQIGSARRLNSRDEAVLGGNFLIPRGRSVTLVVVGNVTTDDNNLSSGAIAGLEVVEVMADAAVQGQFPIRGAAHVMSSSIALQQLDIDVRTSESEIEFDEDTEVVTVRVSLDSSSADEEDAYLRSLTLEQTGSADEDEIGDVNVLVEDDEVDHSLVVDGDRYVITFDGQGVLIEEDEDITVALEINTDTGSGETVRFVLDDPSDIYVVGRSYGYGLAVDADDLMDNSRGGIAVIQSGSVGRGGRISDFEDEVTYGDDRVLGALEVDFEGEDVLMEDLTFDVVLSNYTFVDDDDNDWEDADEPEVTLRNVQLRIDGEAVAYADDDVEFLESDAAAGGENITEEVEFSDTFTVDVRGEREVLFEVIADLDEEWSHFDGARLQFTLTNVGEAEGVRSEEAYNAAAANGRPAGYFYDDRDFESVDIEGNLVDFRITDHGVDDDSFVAGTNNVVFGTLEVDAEDAIDDVEVTDLYVSFEAIGIYDDSGTNRLAMLGDVADCRVMDGEDEVADARGDLNGTFDAGDDNAIGGSGGNADNPAMDQIRFRFDDYVVDAGEEADLDIVCDIDDDAYASHQYRLQTDTSLSGNNQDRVEYEVGSDDFEFYLVAANDNSNYESDAIMVAGAGRLTVQTDNPDDNNTLFSVAVGNNGADDVAVLEIEFEAQDEDITIQDVYLSGLTLPAGSTAINRENLERLIDGATLAVGNRSTNTRPREYEASRAFDYNGDNDSDDSDELVGEAHNQHLLPFEDVNQTIRVEDDEVTATITLDFRSIDDHRGQAGQYLQAANLIVVWEGDESDEGRATRVSLPTGRVSQAIAYPSVPTVTTSERTQSLRNGNNKKLYEFTVAADNEGDVYLAQVGLDISGTSGRVEDLTIRRGTSASGAVVGLKSGDADAGTHLIEFTNVEEIDRGDSVTFSVYGNVAGVQDNDSYIVELTPDNAGSHDLGQSYAGNIGNFVWSPNTYNGSSAHDSGDGSTHADNDDWFSGWSVFDDNDVDSWTSDEDN